MIHRFPILFAMLFGHANVRCDEWEGALREARHVDLGVNASYRDRVAIGHDPGERSGVALTVVHIDANNVMRTVVR
jgi:hypothetical protein